MKHILAIAAGAALAACTPATDEGNSSNAATSAPAANGTDYVAEIRTMAPEQRKATFLRAIRDAQQACQQVVAEQDAGPMNGEAAWTVRCEDGRGWMIVIARDGNAKVTGPVAAKGTTSR
ncbi:hypothetical protein [Sphingomonas sp.]|jgi:hypothetical protein|uniref:hypothetical protein n=1 Tax=Sphingomonas sp. TaxID=28214 RepID=UPI002DF59CD9|nr:hypothetical protein [Sphingomonas sp.]